MILKSKRQFHHNYPGTYNSPIPVSTFFHSPVCSSSSGDDPLELIELIRDELWDDIKAFLSGRYSITSGNQKSKPLCSLVAEPLTERMFGSRILIMGSFNSESDAKPFVPPAAEGMIADLSAGVLEVFESDFDGFDVMNQSELLMQRDVYGDSVLLRRGNS